MNLKFIIFIIFNLSLFQIRSCQHIDSVIINKIHNIEKLLETVKPHPQNPVNGDRSLENQNVTPQQSIENQTISLKPKFDIRFDALPENCTINLETTNCKEATNCTRASGIYILTDSHYSNNTFLVYCDEDIYGGNWLQILKVFDGSENFNRPWKDYVNGFGDINGEFWLGLEKLHALTNYYGPQELIIHLENFEGRTAFARYDNFVVGNADEKYKLKSLGRYRGTIKDDLHSNVGQKFSTYDNDNDVFFRNCAKLRKGGFWFSDCGSVHPTGPYLGGSYETFKEGSFWESFEGMHYAPKSIVFMIRPRKSEEWI